MDERRVAHGTAARLVVILLFRLPDRPQRFRRLRNLCRFAQNPADYSWTYHAQRQVVHLKLSLLTDPWYVGSTTFSAFEHDLNREAKLRQTLKTTSCVFRTCRPLVACYSVIFCVFHQRDSAGSWRCSYAVSFWSLNSPWAHTLLRKQGVHLSQPQQPRAVLEASGHRLAQVCSTVHLD